MSESFPTGLALVAVMVAACLVVGYGTPTSVEAPKPSQSPAETAVPVERREPAIPYREGAAHLVTRSVIGASAESVDPSAYQRSEAYVPPLPPSPAPPQAASAPPPAVPSAGTAAGKASEPRERPAGVPQVETQVVVERERVGRDLAARAALEALRTEQRELHVLRREERFERRELRAGSFGGGGQGGRRVPPR